MLKTLIKPYSKLSHFLLGSFAVIFVIIWIIWNDSFKDPAVLAIAIFWTSSIFFSQWFGNVYIGIKIDERWPILTYPIKRTIIGLFGLIIYSVSAFLVVQTIMYYLFLDGLPTATSTWIWKQVSISLPISFVVSFFFSSIGYFLSWRKSELNAQKLETEMLRYKYESLQNQINPHFLFNSFNVLSDLVEDEPKLAKAFIQKMSGLYRYVLESREQELVPLEEELAFIRMYIFLIKTRFEDKLIVDLDVECGQGLFIVPMALQILVENAIKHNMATSKKVLKVRIFIEGDTVVVSNNLQLKSSLASSTKKGLKNLRQQYEFFTEREISVLNTGSEFVVRLPLVMKN